jgi:hypothetical protein
MKAVLVAAAMTIVLFVLVSLAFRVRPTPHRAQRMTLIYLGCIVLSALLWLATPADLGFLGASLLVQPSGIDLALMLFFFSAAFLGGVLQLYNLADRGFSLRILIDFVEAGGARVGVDQAAVNYGGGQGLPWMYRKRLDGLLAGGFVRRDAGAIVLLPKGRRIADLMLALRRFLRVESRP